MVQVRAILTIADQLQVVYDVPNNTIRNDLELPLTIFQGHAIV